MPQSHSPTSTRSYQALSGHGVPRLLGARPRRLAAKYRYGKGRRGLIAYPGLSATQRPAFTLRLPARIPGSLLTPTFQFIINHLSLFAIIVNYH